MEVTRLQGGWRLARRWHEHLSVDGKRVGTPRVRVSSPLTGSQASSALLRARHAQ